jgi:hypothetical protein
MRAITTEKGYGSVESDSEKILDRTKVLPENVFKQAFKFFLFITFDELFMPMFFNHLKRYLMEIDENCFWLTAIDPDPKIYFGSNFDFFGAIEFSSADTNEDYLSALNNYPEDSPADALAHNTNSLMFFSSQYGWAVYGDRDADIAICAFADIEKMELFKSIYGSDLLGGVSAAADYAYGATGNSVLRAKLCSSYSVD